MQIITTSRRGSVPSTFLHLHLWPGKKIFLFLFQRWGNKAQKGHGVPCPKRCKGQGSNLENLLWSGTFLLRHAKCIPPPCSASPLPHPCSSPAKVPASRSLGKAVERKHDLISETVLQGNWWQEKPSLRTKKRTSLVGQWPMQETQVRSLVWEDSTCCRATQTVRHNYWVRTLEPTSCNYWAYMPQLPQLLKPTCSRAAHNYWTHMRHLLKPSHPEPVLCSKRSHRYEKPTHHNKV